MPGMDSPAAADIDQAIDPERTQLEVWSDVACPWCFVGRRHLQVAIADLDEPDRPQVTWRAWQLDPTIPEGGIDADTYIAARFGAAGDRFAQAREQLVAIGEEVGIAFRFDRQRTFGNTNLAHRVLAAADDAGEREPVLDALFSAHFEHGIDLGDADALREVVAGALDDEHLAGELLERAADDPTLGERVDADIELGRELGISGVPCFVAYRAIAVPGAVPPPGIEQLLAEAAERRRAADDE